MEIEATQRLEEVKHLWSSVEMTNALYEQLSWRKKRIGQDYIEKYLEI